MAQWAVLVLDSSSFFREGVRACLTEGGYSVAGEAESIAQTRHLLSTVKIDLVLVGMTYSEPDGLAVCRQLHRQFPEVKLVLVTEHHADPLFKVDALASGVDALMRRRATHWECWTIIEQVMTGHLMFSREMLAAASQPLKLSAREREIVKLWAEEKTDKEIANQLVFSLNTARTHAKHILRKLQAHTRAEAVRRARRRGLI